MTETEMTVDRLRRNQAATEVADANATMHSLTIDAAKQLIVDELSSLEDIEHLELLLDHPESFGANFLEELADSVVLNGTTQLIDAALAVGISAETLLLNLQLSAKLLDKLSLVQRQQAAEVGLRLLSQATSKCLRPDFLTLLVTAGRYQDAATLLRRETAERFGTSKSAFSLWSTTFVQTLCDLPEAVVRRALADLSLQEPLELDRTAQHRCFEQLQLALSGQDFDSAASLQRLGADITFQQNALLREAVSLHWPEAVAWLLEHGADPAEEPDLVHGTDEFDDSDMLPALFCETSDDIRQLLRFVHHCDAKHISRHDALQLAKTPAVLELFDQRLLRTQAELLSLLKTATTAASGPTRL